MQLTKSTGLKYEVYRDEFGLKQGEEITWFDASRKQVRSKVNYTNDMRDGLSTMYFSNGQVQSELMFSNDQLAGKCYWYYDDGSLEESSSWQEFKRYGHYLFYYNNGQLGERSYWREGNRHGWYEVYFRDGRLEKRGFECEGKDVTQDIDGTVVDINDISDEERVLIKLRYGF